MSVARAVNVSQNSSGWAVRSLELGREWNLTSKSKAASERIVGYSEKGPGPALQRKRNDIKKYR